MKTSRMLAALLLIIASVGMFAGCKSRPDVPPTDYAVASEYRIRIERVRGHEYIVMHGMDSRGGVSIVHAEHCTCKQGVQQ